MEQAGDASLLLLNTCAVRDKAVRKAYGHLGRFKPLKDADPSLIIGLGGCVAQQEGEQLLKEFPYLDLVFGTHNVHRLPELVNAVEVRRGKAAAINFLDKETRLQLFPNRRITSYNVCYTKLLRPSRSARNLLASLLQNLINALQWGSFYALIALGYSYNFV